MAIKVLDRSVIGKIAAGEVVQRPASVVKELIENSIDAGARRIVVEIQGGGQRLIKVTDDGCGIPDTELGTAVQRHATSKISSAEDLQAISSLGFRGEALPSIAAVSRLLIASRPESSAAGAEIRVEGDSEVESKRVGCAVGTSVSVRNLFFNTPARLKFLKSQSSESGHIGSVVSQYALAYPEIQFRLIDEGRKVLSTPGNGELLDVISSVYGADVAREMVPVYGEQVSSVDSTEMTVSGYVSAPSVSRSTRSAISFFVNGRWVQNRMLTFALEEAYRTLLPQGRHPIAVISISLDPKLVDVNVHPAKTEVRFVREREVFGLVQKEVRSALTSFSPIAQFQVLGGSSEQSPSPAPQARMAIEQIGREKPARFEPEMTRHADREQPSIEERVEKRLPVLRVLGQMAATYIVAEGPDGMYLIDQHTAHERVLFERIKTRGGQQAPDRQLLLQPLTVDLLPGHPPAEESARILQEMDFEAEVFGPRAIVIRSVPADLNLEPGEVSRVVQESLSELSEISARSRDETAASLACHSAVRAGQVLSIGEMQSLIRELENTENPLTCPHGRPIMLHVSQAALERQFGRR